MALGEVIRKKNRGEVKFSNKVRPKKAYLSLVSAGLSLALMTAMIVLSVLAEGAAPLYVGAGGMAALALAVLGFVLAVRCFRQDNIYYGMPVAGAVLGGVLMLGWLALYVEGFI